MSDSGSSTGRSFSSVGGHMLVTVAPLADPVRADGDCPTWAVWQAREWRGRPRGRSALHCADLGFPGRKGTTMRPRQRLAAGILVVATLVSGVLAAAPAGAVDGVRAVAAADADEQALAERFAPVVRLVHQDVECGPGEPYQPSDVEIVLGDAERGAARAVGGGRADRGRADGRGSERRAVRLPPGLPGQPARGGLRLRGVGARPLRGRLAHDVRPRGDRGRSGRPAGRSSTGSSTRSTTTPTSTRATGR